MCSIIWEEGLFSGFLDMFRQMQDINWFFIFFNVSNCKKFNALFQLMYLAFNMTFRATFLHPFQFFSSWRVSSIAYIAGIGNTASNAYTSGNPILPVLPLLPVYAIIAVLPILPLKVILPVYALLATTTRKGLFSDEVGTITIAWRKKVYWSQTGKLESISPNLVLLFQRYNNVLEILW